MGKRIILSFLILIIASSLMACNKATPPKKDIGNPPSPQVQEEYKVTSLTYTQNDSKKKVTIKYPQLSGLSGERDKKINEILQTEALKILKYYEGIENFLELDVDYQIVLQNPNVLSVQYSGLSMTQSAAHPIKIFYTTNLDLKNGKRLILKDIVKVDKNLADKFLSGKFKPLNPKQSEWLQNLTNEDMIKSFNEADSLDNTSDTFSYLTNDSLGISIFVPFAIGGHAEFEIKYKDLKDNINPNSDIWNYLIEK